MNPLVILPTYNEADNLERLLGSILEQPIDAHILIVDDASPDGTGVISDRLIQEDAAPGRIHVLHRAAKEGLGPAYRAGFAWAMERDYEIMIGMDADFSHNPCHLPQMIEAAQSADVVVGSRYLNGISIVNWPLHRILLSCGANRYVQAITRLAVKDCTSGFRLYHRRVLEGIDMDSVRATGYSVLVEMLFRAKTAGFQIAEVPIVFTDRERGQSKMSRQVIFESALTPLRLRWHENALRQQLKSAAIPTAAPTLQLVHFEPETDDSERGGTWRRVA